MYDELDEFRFNMNNPKKRIEIRGFAANAKSVKLELHKKQMALPGECTAN